MQSDVPKQFMELCGKPILVHTIEAFKQAVNTLEIIVVLPEVHIELWKKICFKHNFNISHQICIGGEKRFHSVKNGLSMISEKCIVAIHDAVRPLVSKDVIIRCFEEAQDKGSAIPVVSIKDSIRIIDGDKSIALNREKYKAVQTPQCFKSEIIKKAYNCKYKDIFTDDASVAESQGYKMTLVEGNDENIKITTPIDLLYAESLINSK